MELQYAPPAKSPNRVVPVIVAGLLTTILTLVGIYLLDMYAGTNPMGWHANYVIPVGAILVGLIASSGYGIASYLTGLKIRKTLLWAILGLQVAAYFAAQYVGFASLGPLFDRVTRRRVTFVDYFHYTATHFAWKKEVGNGSGEALGNAGYFFIGLEILGFALGSLIVPGVLMKHPYCELCQVYMKRKSLVTIPASVPTRKVKKGDAEAKAAYAAEQRQALEGAQAKVNYLVGLATAGDAAALRQNLDTLSAGRKAAEKLPARVRLSLVRCPACHNGRLEASLAVGQGNQAKTTPLSKTELTREFVWGLAAPATAAPAA